MLSAMRRLIVLGAVLLVAAGCGGGSAQQDAISKSAAPKLVLQQSALGAAFTQFDGGKQVLADRPAGPRFDTTRFDRLGGWKSRFKRTGDATTRGPLVVESRLDLFAADDGAKKDYGAYLLQYHDAAGKALASLGDEAHSFTFTTGSGQFEVSVLHGRVAGTERHRLGERQRLQRQAHARGRAGARTRTGAANGDGSVATAAADSPAAAASGWRGRPACRPRRRAAGRRNDRDSRTRRSQ